MSRRETVVILLPKSAPAGATPGTPGTVTTPGTVAMPGTVTLSLRERTVCHPLAVAGALTMARTGQPEPRLLINSNRFSFSR
ncbi:MAG: hypothetical protein IID61_14835 [SAR324 cluster bacterium]|nr:hypothetical protein [SAR324 cluster bacterium]